MAYNGIDTPIFAYPHIELRDELTPVDPSNPQKRIWYSSELDYQKFMSLLLYYRDVIFVPLNLNPVFYLQNSKLNDAINRGILRTINERPVRFGPKNDRLIIYDYYKIFETEKIIENGAVLSPPPGQLLDRNNDINNAVVLTIMDHVPFPGVDTDPQQIVRFRNENEKLIGKFHHRLHKLCMQFFLKDDGGAIIAKEFSDETARIAELLSSAKMGPVWGSLSLTFIGAAAAAAITEFALQSTGAHSLFTIFGINWITIAITNRFFSTKYVESPYLLEVVYEGTKNGIRFSPQNTFRHNYEIKDVSLVGNVSNRVFFDRKKVVTPFFGRICDNVVKY